MEWQDEGFILHIQNLGERKQVVSLFTHSHGKSAGVFSGSQKTKGWMQLGGKVKTRWGARLESHIGYWSLEPLSTDMIQLMDQPGPLAALLSAIALCQMALPERHPYPSLYEKFEELLSVLKSPHWAQSYIFFELALLDELGYGLDLKRCAVTGVTDDLVAVSPRTGRAVCEEVAKPYKQKLLTLPSFVVADDRKKMELYEEIPDGFLLTGYFLERYLLGRSLPPARERLVHYFSNIRK